VDDAIMEHKSAARRAFAHYLRTGCIVSGPVEPLETKFNPYHDPENGQFTFAPGGPQSLSNVMISDRHSNATRSARQSNPSGTAKPLAAARTPAEQRDIGALSARYEAAAKENPGAVSPGIGDPGGVSYGSYQLSSRKGTADAFVANAEARRWADQFRGLKPGTDAFSQKWRAVAAGNPTAFHAAQKAFVERTLYGVASRKVAHRTGYDLNGASEAMRQVTYSTAVQHGPTGSAAVISEAIRRTDQKLKRNDPAYQAALINNIYDRRTEIFGAMRQRALKAVDSRSAKNHDNVIKDRFPRERADALRILAGE
jgi:hypothetical protein